ncbi:MAG: hypothetical protein ACI4XS_13580 [Bacillus sp. (in: firmicutes)]
MSDYIKIDKQFILDNINNDKFKLWIWIIANACDSCCVIDGVELSRGQLLLSTREVEKLLGISRRRARTICSELAKESVIECKPESGKTTIITINNYDDYVVTHFRPTSNTDNQKVKEYSDPLSTHLQEKATHLTTHSNVCNTTSYDIERPTYRPTQNFEKKETKEKKEKFPPYPPYKEKKESKEKFIVVNTRTRVREEIFFDEILEDLKNRKILVEGFCKNEGIDINEFFKLANLAMEEIKFTKNDFVDDNDCRKHLINMMRVKIHYNNKQKQNGNKQKNIRRASMETSALTTEDYEKPF